MKALTNIILLAGVAATAGCATVAKDQSSDASNGAVAANTRSYCRSDIERTGQTDVASAVRRSASSARQC
ncbi:MAG: hypothetical protein AB8B96_04820 [Lysobacterales bacterium]